jgi:hypothetical protein
MRLCLEQPVHCRNPPNGGRTWWAHFALPRINIEPTFLRKKFEDLREAAETWAQHDGAYREQTIDRPPSSKPLQC